MSFHFIHPLQPVGRSRVGFWLLRSLSAPTAARDNRADRGLTMMENLVAIVVITLTLMSITPPIFWATASRVQTTRAEQALQVAQGELDRVRNLVERNQADLGDFLPPAGGTEAQVRNGGVAAPTKAKDNPAAEKDGLMVSSNSSCPKDNGIPSAEDIYIRVDHNGDCEPDFLMQTFRSRGVDANGVATPANTPPAAFVMGVRVYAAIAKDKLKAGAGKIQQASLRGTTGLGNQIDSPLATIYSTIVPSSLGSNLDIYRNLCPAPVADLQGERSC